MTETERDDSSVEPKELERESRGLAGLHPLALVAFAAGGLAVGIGAAFAFSPALAVPLGLLGGGVGVWVVERARRLR